MTFPGPNLGILAALANRVSINDVLGLSNRFHVTMDDIDLGAWGQCHGLEVTFDAKPVPQGGVYDYEQLLPEQMKYSPITLQRAVNAKDSMQLQGWLAGQIDKWMHAVNAKEGSGAKITLYAADASPVMSWSLRGVYPSKWSGPKLDALTSGIAMEELTFTHQGFL
jgi:phage tail-like protein